LGNRALLWLYRGKAYHSLGAAYANLPVQQFATDLL